MGNKAWELALVIESLGLLEQSVKRDLTTIEVLKRRKAALQKELDESSTAYSNMSAVSVSTSEVLSNAMKGA